MKVKIEKSWEELLADEFEKPYFKDLVDFVKSQYQTNIVFPPGKEIFEAFNSCPVDEVKVVIIGQDPYHGPGQAHGLSFSVNEGVSLPPSLKNIFKEIKDDLGKEIPVSGDLTRWAKQGVLLLNATLTVRAHNAGSHQGKGWEEFTDSVIKKISAHKNNLVFLLWGAFARRKAELIIDRDHLILEAAHPSPFSADKGFFGCKHFSKTNDFLKEKGLKQINW